MKTSLARFSLSGIWRTDSRPSRQRFYSRRPTVLQGPMSALGHKQTYAVRKAMSALPPKADMCGALAHVRFGPKADNGPIYRTDTQIFGEITMSCRRGRGQREQTLLELLVVDCVQPSQTRGARKGR